MDDTVSPSLQLCEGDANGTDAVLDCDKIYRAKCGKTGLRDTGG